MSKPQFRFAAHLISLAGKASLQPVVNLRTGGGHIHPHSVISGRFASPCRLVGQAEARDPPLMVIPRPRCLRRVRNFVHATPEPGNGLPRGSWLRRNEVTVNAAKFERISISFNHADSIAAGLIRRSNLRPHAIAGERPPVCCHRPALCPDNLRNHPVDDMKPAPGRCKSAEPSAPHSAASTMTLGAKTQGHAGWSLVLAVAQRQVDDMALDKRGPSAAGRQLAKPRHSRRNPDQATGPLQVAAQRVPGTGLANGIEIADRQ
jgi:hypothetical protein